MLRFGSFYRGNKQSKTFVKSRPDTDLTYSFQRPSAIAEMDPPVSVPATTEAETGLATNEVEERSDHVAAQLPDSPAHVVYVVAESSVVENQPDQVTDDPPDDSVVEQPFERESESEHADDDGSTLNEAEVENAGRAGPPGSRPVLRGEAGGASWRSARTPSARRPFRPRAEPPPAWKHFEGVALHLRPSVAHAAAPHKRHAPAAHHFPGGQGPRGVTPLRIVPPSWQQPPQPQPQLRPLGLAGYPAWGVRLLHHQQQQQQQPVWGLSGLAAWGPRPVHVVYGAPIAPVPCQACPPVPQGLPQGLQALQGLHGLHQGLLQPAPPPCGPLSPGAGSTWTC